MPIKIITIGKKHDNWVAIGLETYQKRLKRPFNIEWLVLPNSKQSGPESRKNEAGRILASISTDDYVVLLDETGRNITSTELSKLIKGRLDKSKNVVFIIGGSYGADEAVFGRADYVWSLSKLVFPHQIVRLLLTEQIYRAQEIVNNKPYHHS